MEKITLNIQPNAGILNVFSRLNYKPWYAIAEFVDNATQSYFSHIHELKSIKGFKKLIININYYEKIDTLYIKDNAYGMNIEEFKRAILLDSSNGEQQGRNEFGMGLKTAASWFGNKWTVQSTQFGVNSEYKAIIDINYLKESGANSIEIIQQFSPENEYGTTIVIEDVTKKITGARTRGKIRSLLSSMYRRDISNGDIEIYFDNELLVFEPFDILHGFRDKFWKKDLDFSFMFNNQQFEVKGFVGIMEKGSFPKSGFALFRRNRVVIGGEEENYKPSQIFGQQQSQVSLKLFGELDLDDFPINQAKDGFIWDDGLEDLFLDALKQNIDEYIRVADISKKDRISESSISAETAQNIQSVVQTSIDKINNVTLTEKKDPLVEQTKFNEEDDLQDSVENYIEQYIEIKGDVKILEESREYIVSQSIGKLKVIVKWAINNDSFWINIDIIDDSEIIVILNVDHPFFKPFSSDFNFKVILEKFAISFALAERDALLLVDDEGKILPNVIRRKMNRYLSVLTEE